MEIFATQHLTYNYLLTRCLTFLAIPFEQKKKKTSCTQLALVEELTTDNSLSNDRHEHC